MKDNPFEEQSEAQITKSIKDWLKKNYPGVWYKIHGGPYQEAGIPDIIGCCRGRWYAFEVKKPGRRNRVSDTQKYQLERLKKAGAVVGVVTSIQETQEIIDLGVT